MPDVQASLRHKDVPPRVAISDGMREKNENRTFRFSPSDPSGMKGSEAFFMFNEILDTP